MVAINPDIECGRCLKGCGISDARSRGLRDGVITAAGGGGIGQSRSCPDSGALVAVDIARPTMRVTRCTFVLRPPDPMSVVLPSFTRHFATLAGDYDVVLCDVWGVVHNGVAAAAEAGDALTRFRERGGTVVLITNAPRPGEKVARLTLDRLGVPRAAYDGIVSSGDVTRALIAARAGARVFHIGPERDLPLFEGLDAPLAALEHADYAVCTGLNDDTVETPHDYRDLIARMRARSLPMICANPDVVVERGDKLVYCAGAIADPYAAAGGEVIYAGKPYRPIYEQALALADAALSGIFAAAGVAPKAVMHQLSW